MFTVQRSWQRLRAHAEGLFFFAFLTNSYIIILIINVFQRNLEYKFLTNMTVIERSLGKRSKCVIRRCTQSVQLDNRYQLVKVQLIIIYRLQQILAFVQLDNQPKGVFTVRSLYKFLVNQNAIPLNKLVLTKGCYLNIRQSSTAKLQQQGNYTKPIFRLSCCKNCFKDCSSCIC